MGSVRERGKFQFQARVIRKGWPRETSTHNSRAEAEAWVRLIESEMDRGIFVSRTEAENTTLRQALDRYLVEITPTKRGKSQETTLINRWKQDPLATRFLASLRGADFAAYRDKRKAQGKSGNTIRIELALIGHLFETARCEWGIESLANPIRNIRKPSTSNERERRLAAGEQERILKAMRTLGRNPWMEAAFVLALETALRRSMLVKLRWEWIDLERSIITIPPELREIENKGVPVAIPVWREAREVLQALPRSVDGRVLPMTANALTCCWNRLRADDSGGTFRDLRWHDLRHEATSRLFEKGLNPIEVQSVTGHKSMQMLKRYAHLRAANLLEKYG